MDLPGQLELDLHPDKRAPGEARRAARAHFGPHLAAVELETAILLVSELVTNAVLHGEGVVCVRADLDRNRLRVEVIDHGGGFEHVLREHHFEAIGGRGLKIVDSQASRWGIKEGTTHVWFELERPGPRLGPAVV